MIETDRPLAPSQQGLFVYDGSDVPRHLTTAWHPAPGVNVTTGVLTVWARDAADAADAAIGLMLVATGRACPYRITAIIKEGTGWPPIWWTSE